MEETIEIHFGYETGNSLKISVKDYKYPEDEDEWYGNWVIAQVDVVAGPFSGMVEGELRMDALERFFNELHLLHNDLSGEVTFSTFYAWLSLNITINKFGILYMQTRIKDPSDKDERDILNFVISVDQTFLKMPLKQLEKTLKRFPVRGEK